MLEGAGPPFLPGEQVRHVFLAQGRPPAERDFLDWPVVFWVKYRIIVVTDQAVLVLDGKKLAPAKPNGVAALARGPPYRTTMSGLWGVTNFAGEKLWVHKLSQGHVGAADGDIRARELSAVPGVRTASERTGYSTSARSATGRPKASATPW